MIFQPEEGVRRVGVRGNRGVQRQGRSWREGGQKGRSGAGKLLGVDR